MIDKILLAPYYLALKTRHLMFDTGMRKVHKADVPTICLGNVTVGGTGKTPHTEMLIRMLSTNEQWAGKQLAVLSRGYKRTSKRFQQVMAGGPATLYGDEPTQIKNKFPEVVVAVDKNRVRGCNFLSNPDALKADKKVKKCMNPDFPAADLILLDDAFQYRNLKATVNVVLVDYSRPIFKDYLMPIGSLRDLPSRISAADIIVVSKCPSYLDEWERGKWASSLGLTHFNPATCCGVNSKGREQYLLFTTIGYDQPEAVFPEGDPRYMYAKRLVLFTGIANDKPLMTYLGDTYKIVKHIQFPDHHSFSKSDINSIQAAANAFPTSIVVTTEKDSQRIAEHAEIPLELKQRMFYMPISVKFLTPEEEAIFKEALLSRL